MFVVLSLDQQCWNNTLARFDAEYVGYSDYAARYHGPGRRIKSGQMDGSISKSPIARDLVAAVVLLMLLGGCETSPPGGATASSPDLSGIWEMDFVGDVPLLDEFPLTDWGRERFDSARPLRGPTPFAAFESNDPELSCAPMGIPATYFRPRPIEIVQFADRLLMLLEVGSLFRIIYTDGRNFPDDGVETWNGYAIGQYEGDTLVIETRGFRGWESEEQQRWLDRLGHPFSDELVLTERLRLIDNETLENQITVDDPIAYTQPWSATLTFKRRRDTELAEFICHEADNAAYAEFERQLLQGGDHQ